MKKKNEERKVKVIILDDDGFPSDYPFWARLKIDKNRTTLIIDRDLVKDKNKEVLVPGFIHREATSKFKKDREKIYPNPDKTKKNPMYLKSPRSIPKSLIRKHNKNLEIPEYLKERYSKNKS